MKNNRLLKALIILIIIAICLISFVGIFVKDNNQRINILPDYLLSTNLSGARVAKLDVDTSSNEVIYDSEGNVSQDGENEDGTLKEGYTKKEEKVNPDEVLTVENYEKSKRIIEKRLKEYGVQDFNLRLNNNNGQIILELPENSNTDTLLANITYVGKFEILDSETKEVLLDYSKVKDAKAVYSNTDFGTRVFLSIEFNDEGKAKLEEITKTYIETTDEEGNKTTKEISINIDNETLLETYFSETITNGTLQLSIGSASTDSEEIASYLDQAAQVATLIDSNIMPIKYNLDTNTYLSSALNKDILQIVMYIIIAIVAIALVYECVKYKLKGLLASLSYIGCIALLLIVLRYTNVVISLEAISALIILLILNYTFVKNILEKLENKDLSIKEITKQVYLKYAWILFPLLLVSITFTFMSWIPVSSIGMVMFWGIVTIYIYNYIITVTLLKDEK